MNTDKLSSFLLKDTLVRAIEMDLEDDFIRLLKKELSKKESEQKARSSTE